MKKSHQKILVYSIILLLVTVFIITPIYTFYNPINDLDFDDSKIKTRRITITHNGKTQQYEYDYIETEEGIEKIGDYRLIRFAPSSEGYYISQPTSFTDVDIAWSNEGYAYDWNNATYAELDSMGDAADLDLHTFNTSDSESETITQVDVYTRADWSISGNDYITIEWYVSATQGSGTYQMNSGNSGDDQLITFLDVTEPIDSSWSWTDISNVVITFNTEQVQNPDVTYAQIDEVWILVHVEPPEEDTTPPDISSPSDDTIELGATGETIDWVVGDQNPNNYVIYKNTSNIESGSWTNGTIDADLDGLDLGIWNFTLWADDVSGNDATDLVWITCSDTTNPILDSPSDFEYEYGSSGNKITWTATDLDADTYEVEKDGSPYDSGSWTSGVGLDVDVDGLSLGLDYNFTIIVYDGTGNKDVDTVLIDVVDETKPNLNEPADITDYELGSSGNEVSWTATDLLPDYYFIYRNETKIDEGSWSSGVPITKNIDSLSLGIYNFSIWVNDTSGNIDTDYLWVTVQDSTNPILNEPADDTIEFGSSGNQIIWVATDLDPDNFIVYKNTSTHDSGSWSSGVDIIIDIDGFTLGLWNMTIIVFDGSENSDVDLVWILVEDSTNPILNEPADDTIELGSSGNQIIWVATDLDPDNFIVYKNTSTYDSGSWSSGVNIVIDIDGFALGLWNMTIIVFDGSENSDSDLVWILVEDTTNPILNEPANDSYIFGSTGNTIIWIATDLLPDNFIVYKNTSTYDSGSWSSGVNIVIDIDGFALGLWNMTIIVFDSSGNSDVDLVWITVTDLDSVPPLINQPANVTYVEGSTGNIIIWIAIDDYPDNYSVYCNSELFDSGFWSSGVNIVVNVDGLTVTSSYGINAWNITILVQDESSNTNSSSVFVTVLPGEEGIGPYIPPDHTSTPTKAEFFSPEVIVAMLLAIIFIIIIVLIGYSDKEKNEVK